MPSRVDVSKFESALNKQLEVQQKKLTTAKSHKLPKMVGLIQATRQEMEVVRAHVPILGTAVATSGFRSVKSDGAHWAMDWALINITNGRGCSNLVPGWLMQKESFSEWSMEEIGV